MRLSDLFEDELDSIEKVKQLRPQLAQAAQQVYESWDQDEDGYDEELGSGGICQDIADAMSDVLNEQGIDSITVDTNGVGDQHVWIVIQVAEGVFEVDIPPHVYETGSGYTWRKRPGILIEPSDVVIDKLSDNPDDFDQYGEY